MPSRVVTLGITSLLLTMTTAAAPQTPIDPNAAACITTAKAIDNHAHPVRAIPFGAPALFMGPRKSVRLARGNERIHERHAHQQP